MVKYVNNNPESVNVSDLSSAMYVVKMQKGKWYVARRCLRNKEDCFRLITV
ncbi:hypothetical protein [Barnesiella intestinihominis]|uniref:hypothetical protein n=1 Tax=Barnesiella intestinihominis TaxID=487174 RepID=UPI0039A333EF